MSRRLFVKRMFLPILLVGMLFSIGVGLGLADPSDNGEGGLESPIDSTLSGSDVEVVVNPTEPPPGNERFTAEGYLETGASNGVSEEIELWVSPDVPQAQFFKRSAGSNFKPRDSTTAYSYSGGGCVQRNSNTGDSWFTIDLQLPEGAEIDFLRVYYYDNDATYDINSELWAFDGAGGTTLIAEADSSGAPGYSSTGSDFFSHIVDNINESLVVVASIQGGVGANVQLCGIRVRYQYNLNGGFLPAVLNMATP